MNNFRKNSPNRYLPLSKNGLATFLFSFFVSLCFGQTGLKYVPSTADVVITVNLQSLDKKVNLAQLKQYDFFQAMVKEMNKTPKMENDTSMQEYFGKLITDPTSLGFNSQEPFYFFVEKVGFDTYMTFVQAMGDQQRYEAAARQLKGDDFETNLSEREGVKIWQKGNELFAWNKEVVINVMHEKGMDPNAMDGGYGENTYYPDYSDTTTIVEDYVYEEPEPLNESDTIFLEGMDMVENDSAQIISEANDTSSFGIEDYAETFDLVEAPDTAAYEWAVKVLSRKFLQPISRNERFALAKGKTDDVHFWMDYGFFTDSMKRYSGGMYPTNSYSQMMNAMNNMTEVFYGDTYVSMGLNFEDGRMAIRSQAFINEDMKRFYRRSMDTKFNKKFLRYVKGGDEMFGYFYLNYNIKNTIEETKNLMYKIFDATPQYGQAASDAMKIIGIFIDEEAIGNLLKGDLMMSVSGLQTIAVNTKTYQYDADFQATEKDTTIMKTMPVFTVLASYGNGKDIQKFIDLGVHSNVLVLDGSYYRIALPDMDGQQFFLAKHDGLLIFTNNQYLMQQNLADGFAKKLRLPKNHKKMLCDKAAVVYWNIPNTIRAAAGSQADSNIGLTGYMNSLSKEFHSIEMTSSKKVGDSVDSEIFLKMTQKETNSLQQFFNFVNDMYLEVIGGAKI